jgi:hypothetical protein
MIVKLLSVSMNTGDSEAYDHIYFYLPEVMQRPYFLLPWYHKGVGMTSLVSVLGRNQVFVACSQVDESLQAMFLLLGYLEPEYIIHISNL